MEKLVRTLINLCYLSISKVLDFFFTLQITDLMQKFENLTSHMVHGKSKIIEARFKLKIFENNEHPNKHMNIYKYM